MIARNEQPHHVPARRRHRRAPDWAQRDEASLIAPTAQNLDAAPPLSMHLRGMHVMTPSHLCPISLHLPSLISIVIRPC